MAPMKQPSLKKQGSLFLLTAALASLALFVTRQPAAGQLSSTSSAPVAAGTANSFTITSQGPNYKVMTATNWEVTASGKRVPHRQS